MSFLPTNQFTQLSKSLRTWFDLETSWGEYGCFWSSTQLTVWDVRTGKQVTLPAVLIRDQRTDVFVGVGEVAEKMRLNLKEGQEAVQPFLQGRVADVDAARILFQTAFQTLLGVVQLPLWFFPKLQIISINQKFPIYERAVTRLCQNLGCRSIMTIPLSELVIKRLYPDSPITLHFGVVVIEEDMIEISLISRTSQQIVSHLKFGIQHVKQQLSFLFKNRLNLDMSESELLRLLDDYFHRRTNLKTKAKSTNSAWRTTVRGKDALTGELVSSVVSSEQVAPLLEEALSALVEQLTDFFEKLPGEYSSDLMKQGIVLVETQQQFPGLSEYLAEVTSIPVFSLPWQETVLQPRSKVRQL